MTIRLGYVCINLSLQEGKKGPRFKALTAKRLSTMEPRERRVHLYQVGKNNLETVAAILRWNAAHGIRLYRITSELIPLATHPVAAGWDWEGDLAAEFATVAGLARETGSRRLRPVPGADRRPGPGCDAGVQGEGPGAPPTAARSGGARLDDIVDRLSGRLLVSRRPLCASYPSMRSRSQIGKARRMRAAMRAPMMFRACGPIFSSAAQPER
jgi:hypothetical protein